MKTQHSTELNCLALDDSCFIVYYVSESTGTKIVPVLLYYVIVANMSKNSCLSYFYAPFEAKSGAKV